MKNTYTTGAPKKPHELEDCPKNSRIILVFYNGEEYHGIFRGMDGDYTIMLRSETDKPSTIGLPINALKFWLLKT